MQWWHQPLFDHPICDLFVCLKQTPFTLTLRLWDIYILEGERVLTAMAYTILKLHKSKVLPDCIPYGCGGTVLGHPCAADLKSFASHFHSLCALCWPPRALSRGGNEMPQGFTWCAQNTETTPEMLSNASSYVLCPPNCFWEQYRQQPICLQKFMWWNNWKLCRETSKAINTLFKWSKLGFLA